MLARKVERRLLFASTLEVCTGGEEQGEAVGVASECTDAERCVLVAYAPHVDGRACLQQQLHTRRAALDAAREQRRRAARARARWIGPGTQQKPRTLNIAVRGAHKERRRVALGGVDVGLRVHEHERALDVPVCYRDEERRRAIVGRAPTYVGARP